jgi:DNA-binding NarL/FixJ family response regulator
MRQWAGEKMDRKSNKIAILGGCFLMRSALELILLDLKVPYIIAEEPSEVPPDASVVLLSYATIDALSECVASCMKNLVPARIVLFPQDKVLFESIRSLPANVAAVVPPTLPAAKIKSVISVVIEGHRILPFKLSNEGVGGDEPSGSIQLGLLTSRQLEILEEVAKGQSNKAIARNLSISINTVEAHVSAIIRKLQVDNRTQAAIALRGGIASSKKTPVIRRVGKSPRDERSTLQSSLHH